MAPKHEMATMAAKRTPPTAPNISRPKSSPTVFEWETRSFGKTIKYAEDQCRRCVAIQLVFQDLQRRGRRHSQMFAAKNMTMTSGTEMCIARGRSLDTFFISPAT